MSADGADVLHLPGTSFVTIRAGRECTDGADIDAHAALFALEMIVLIRRDYRADAALLNVQAIINSERAWIDGEVVKTERIGVIRHALKVTNHGKTPARIIGYDFQHGVLEEGPDFSSGTLSTHFSEEAYLLLGSGETKTVRDDFDMADIFSSLNVNSMGTFRVTIKYFDIVSEGVERKVRETCLVYLYKPFLSALAPLYERNQYT